MVLDTECITQSLALLLFCFFALETKGHSRKILIELSVILISIRRSINDYGFCKP